LLLPQPLELAADDMDVVSDEPPVLRATSPREPCPGDDRPNFLERHRVEPPLVFLVRSRGWRPEATPAPQAITGGALSRAGGHARRARPRGQRVCCASWRAARPHSPNG